MTEPYANLKRLREADAAVLRTAADYLKRLPVCPATHEVIQKIEQQLADPSGTARANGTLTGTMYSPAGFPILTVAVQGADVFVSLPTVPEWPKERLGRELLRRLESADEPLPVRLD